MSFFPNAALLGSPTGAASGVLSGTYPGPGFAAAPSFSGGLTVTTGNVGISAGSETITGGNLDVATAGNGLRVAEGSNAKQGTATLTAGTVTVGNTSVTANSRIFLTGQVLGGTAGGLNVTSRTPGTSFVVTSTNAADTSTFAYEILEPG